MTFDFDPFKLNKFILHNTQGIVLIFSHMMWIILNLCLITEYCNCLTKLSFCSELFTVCVRRFLKYIFKFDFLNERGFALLSNQWMHLICYIITGRCCFFLLSKHSLSSNNVMMTLTAMLNSPLFSGRPVTYIRVTRNSNKIPILNSNNTVMYLTQVNEVIYTIGFYLCFGIHSVISLLFT